jgi:hypothetical protein
MPANTRDRPWVGKIATHDLLAMHVLPPSRRMTGNGAASFRSRSRESAHGYHDHARSNPAQRRDSAPGYGAQEQQRKRAAVGETDNCSELREGDAAVTTHFDLRSLASLWATATCDGVMLAATKSREKAACAAPSAAAKSNHIYAAT